MSVRSPGGSLGHSSSPEHRSFHLSRPEKKAFTQSAFEKYQPQEYQQHAKQHSPADVQDADREFYLRQVQGGRTLETREDVEKFARGFLKDAHAEGARLRGGLNTERREYEQAKQLAKEYLKKHTDQPDPHKVHHSIMTAMRDRLGIQHGPAPAAEFKPAWQAPEPLGLDTSPATPEPTGGSPATPVFNPASQAFIGGRLGQVSKPAAPASTAVPANQPPPEPPSPTPAAPAPTPNNDPAIPDPDDAQALPI